MSLYSRFAEARGHSSRVQSRRSVLPRRTLCASLDIGKPPSTGFSSHLPGRFVCRERPCKPSRLAFLEFRALPVRPRGSRVATTSARYTGKVPTSLSTPRFLSKVVQERATTPEFPSALRPHPDVRLDEQMPGSTADNNLARHP